jgi:hypothetical protein
MGYGYMRQPGHGGFNDLVVEEVYVMSGNLSTGDISIKLATHMIYEESEAFV